MNPPPVATVVFPTRNRREVLLTAIAAAYAQTVPVEVLVMDDGSTDGSAEAVQERFPTVRYHQLAAGRGPAFQRNRGIELAGAPFVFPLDDDAVLVSPRTVEQTVAEFDFPCVGAVGVPYVNVRVDGVIRQRAPDDGKVWVADTFVGAAHAVRRADFLAVGGFREHLFYMGEEGDLTLRMLAAGRVTRVGRADPIAHHESPHRVTARANYYGRRNDVLFALHNVPARELSVHLAGTLLNGLMAAARAEHPARMIAGLMAGIWEGVRRWPRERRPVGREIYRLHRCLKKGGALPLGEIEVRSRRKIVSG